jgi:hypothetical protein
VILSDLYYFAKPAIPLRVRLALKRMLAGHLSQKHADVWPINEAASKVPVQWPGWPEGKQFAFVLTHDVEGKRGIARCQELAELRSAMGSDLRLILCRRGISSSGISTRISHNERIRSRRP